MTLTDFRKSYPQYDDMSDYDLTTKLHAKYYSDMPIESFYKKLDYTPNKNDDVSLTDTVLQMGKDFTSGVSRSLNSIKDETNDVANTYSQGQSVVPNRPDNFKEFVKNDTKEEAPQSIAQQVWDGVKHIAALPSNAMQEALSQSPTKTVDKALGGAATSLDKTYEYASKNYLTPMLNSILGTSDNVLTQKVNPYLEERRKQSENYVKDSSIGEVGAMSTDPLNVLLAGEGGAISRALQGAGVGSLMASRDANINNKEIDPKQLAANSILMGALTGGHALLSKGKTSEITNGMTDQEKQVAQGLSDRFNRPSKTVETITDRPDYKTMDELKTYISENDKGGQAQADFFEKQMGLWAKAENIRRIEEGREPVTAEQIANDFILNYDKTKQDTVNSNSTLADLQSNPRYQELMDTRRDVSSKDTQYSQTLAQPRGTDADGNWYGASYDRNFNADFELTKADVKAIESGKATPEQITKLRNDLGRLDNDPMYKQSPLDANEQLATNGELFQFVGAKDNEQGAFSDTSTRKVMKEIDDSGARLKNVIDPIIEQKQTEIQSKINELQRQRDEIYANNKTLTEEQKYRIETNFKNRMQSLELQMPKNVLNDISTRHYRDYGAKLSNILDHEELYKKYPQLKDTHVEFDDTLDGANAFYDPERNVIGISRNLWKLSKDEQIKTISHEIQHKIQQIEKMPSGGSPKEFIMAQKKAKDAVKYEEDNFLEWREAEQWARYKSGELKFEDTTQGFLEEMTEKQYIDKMTKLEKEKPFYAMDLEYINKHLDDAHQRYNKAYESLDRESPLQKYFRLYGEQQARATEYRKDMTPEQRTKESWQQTLERVEGKYEEPIIRYDDNTLNQNIKGSYTIDQKLIQIFKDSDSSTINHELGHRFLFTLNAKERAIAEQVFGVKDGKWEVKNHEAFADAYARYIADGRVQHEGLRAIFEKFKEFTKKILSDLQANNGGKLPPMSKEAKEFFAAVLGNEKARNELMKKYTSKDASSMGEGELFSKAYHGTPHNVDKFDTEKIGTGEGAQAYGYGLYFADSKELAEWYKNKLSKNILIHPDVKEKYYKEWGYLAKKQEEALDNHDRISAQKYSDAIDELLYKMKDETSKSEKFNGNLYRVDLKPKEEEYLLWDKPLDEQSLHVKEALQKELDIYRKSDGAKGAYVNNSSGEKLYKEFIYTYGSDKKASERLNELGIKGIKYEDGNSRSRDVNKNHNYVIFKNEDVEITGANGKMFDGTPNELFQKRQDRLMEWHKDSAPETKNADGTPKVFYHGTGKSFDEFKTNPTSWVSENSNHANRYAKPTVLWKEGGDNIMPVYVNAKNPYTLPKENIKTTERELIVDMINEADNIKLIDDNTLSKIKSILSLASREKEEASLIWNSSYKMKEVAELLGYDSYKALEVDSRMNNNPSYSSTIAVFSPTQIKSIHNKGTFDETNPNILYQIPQNLLASQQSATIGHDVSTLKNVYEKAKEFTKEVVDSFKIQTPDYYGKMLDDRFTAIGKAQNDAETIHKALMQFSPETNKILQRAIVGDIKSLPQGYEVLQPIVDGVRAEIKRYTKQLVNLGMIDKDTALAYEDTYLKRSYASHYSDEGKGSGSKTVPTMHTRGAQIESADVDSILAFVNKRLDAMGEKEIVNPMDITDIHDELQSRNLLDSSIAKGKFTWKETNGKVEVRTDWTKSERESMGEIENAAVTVPATLLKMNLMLENAKLMREVSRKAGNFKNEEEAIANGYERIPDTQRYGELRGMYVEKSIAEDLKYAFEMEDTIFKTYKQATALWKMGKTVFNPVSHVNNFLGNVSTQLMLGRTMKESLEMVKETASQAKAFATSIREYEALHVKDFSKTLTPDEITRYNVLKNELKYYIEGKDNGLFGRGQITDILTKYNPLTNDFGGQGIVGETLKSINRAYQSGDDIPRLASYKVLRESGMDAKEAKEFVNSVFPDYSKQLPKGIRFLRDWGLSPFISWSYYVLPNIAKLAKKHPTRALGLLSSVYLASYAMSGINPFGDEIPDKDQGRRVPISSDGTSLKVDRLIPAFDIASLPLDVVTKLANGLYNGKGIGALNDAVNAVGRDSAKLAQSYLLGGIPSTLVGLANNRDLYSGRSITGDDNNAAKETYNALKYILGQLSPAVLTTIGGIAENAIVPKDVKKKYSDVEPRTNIQEALKLLGINTLTYNTNEVEKKRRRQDAKLLK